MKRIVLFTCLLLMANTLFAQHRITLTVIDKESKQVLPGTTLSFKAQSKSFVADSTGKIVVTNIPVGVQTFQLSHVGFSELELRYTFPLTGKEIVTIELEPAEEEEEEEVVVMSTRISRTIANNPTRMEVISGEELTEKGNMKPGDIRMMLNESTGIQTQQTSATSYNSSIRIQGLDGRYTQILRDGYPLYAGFSGGLSLLQIAPLDLKQVEVIKGSASTLYGGGAIAGLVNLVSKTPGEERSLDFLANGTSAGGLDLSGFYSERYGKVGLTMFASRNSNTAYDPADIGLSAIPKFERYTINPRLFVYGKNTTMDLGLSLITEDRIGGNMSYIKNGGSGFYEKNNTDRVTTQFGLAHRLGEHSTLQIKNSYSRFDRIIEIPSYRFDALQQSSFSELTWNRKGDQSDWVVGANFITDQLRERSVNANSPRDYSYQTFGVFIQNAWNVTEQFTLETGLRGDHINAYGFELLPRVSAMYRLSSKLTTRLGGGFGYKAPTIFTEEAERMHFRNFNSINVNATRNERSVGVNWDINYSTRIGEVGLSINHLFFYTRLNHPLVLSVSGGMPVFDYQNSTGFVDTKGMETNLRLTYGDFKLFIGYTHTLANTHFNSKQLLPLTAKHRLNNVLMYEVEDKLKIGLEAYYYSRQRLSDGTNNGRPYLIAGLMAEKLWEKFSLFINFENFTNVRQTKFGSIYTGNINNPFFKDIYAPLDGFVVNGGVKLKL